MGGESMLPSPRLICHTAALSLMSLSDFSSFLLTSHPFFIFSSPRGKSSTCPSHSALCCQKTGLRNVASAFLISIFAPPLAVSGETWRSFTLVWCVCVHGEQINTGTYFFTPQINVKHHQMLQNNKTPTSRISRIQRLLVLDVFSLLSFHFTSNRSHRRSATSFAPPFSSVSVLCDLQTSTTRSCGLQLRSSPPS